MPTTLRVYPNPYKHLSADGLPQATFPFDPEHAPGARRWVGATIDRSPDHDGKPKTRAIEKRTSADFTVVAKVDGQKQRVTVKTEPEVRVVFAFDLSPQPVPETAHYLRGIRTGDLIPADVETSRAASVAFVDPAEALRTAAETAVAEWHAAHGAPPAIDTWPDYLRAPLVPASAEEEAPVTPPVLTPNTTGADAAPAP